MALLSSAQMASYDNAERRRYPAIYREVSSSHQSRYIELEQAFAALRDQLKKLRLLRANWDTYGAPAPNDVALAAADAALRMFRVMDVLPTRVLPSADGGIGILFTEREQYAHIEFENSGDTWVLIYGSNNPPITWQLPSGDPDSLREAWDRISASLQS